MSEIANSVVKGVEVESEINGEAHHTMFWACNIPDMWLVRAHSS